MIEQKIGQDLKAAMLAQDKLATETLRGIKSVFLYFKVANGKKDQELTDQEAISLLSKESKKRQESSDLYIQGGNQEKSDKELSEKEIIDSYLPKKISNQELENIVDKVISENSEMAMGQIISTVREETAGTADGSDIARIVKEKLVK